MYSFPNLETVHCSMSSSNCCFLAYKQISHETGILIFLRIFHSLLWPTQSKTLAFSVKQKSMFFWNSLDFSVIQRILAIWSVIHLRFLNPTWTFGSSQLTNCWSLAWRILSITLLALEMSAILWFFEHSLALPFFGIRMKTDIFPVLWPLWSFPNLLAYWVQRFRSIIF